VETPQLTGREREMGDVITFSNVEVLYFEVRKKEGAPCFVRVHVAADFGDGIAKQMGWSEIPDCVGTCDLAGEIHASHMTLTPSEKGLRGHEVQLSVIGAESFRLVGIQTEDGVRSGRELRFRLVSADPNAAALLAQYMHRVGDASAVLKVWSVVQEELALGAEG
jgi:hypothetical protein